MASVTIQNNWMSASICHLGAELTSLKNKAGIELLWQADKSVWPRHAPVLFPIVGRLKDNSVAHNGTEIQLSQHGFARDKEFTLIQKSNERVAFELTANDETLSLFPFHFSLIIEYALNGKSLDVNYRVFNPSSTTLLFSIGAHPGFSCRRTNDESISDFYLEFENQQELLVEKLNDGLLANETYVLPLTKHQLPLTKALFDKDALVLKNNQINTISLCSHKSPTRIEMHCKDWPYFGIWTKKDCDQFICLEPWYGITDNINSSGNLAEKEGIISLESYQSRQFHYSIALN